MRFEADFSGPRAVLRASFESGDRHTGNRQEGAGTPITYSGEDIEFDYVPDEIHPDLLGLLFLTIYYPFVGERAVFPAPVSPRLEAAFRSSAFDRRIRFDNVDASLEPYIGSRMALAFGGGTDSSAVLSMFPEAFVVHEAHVRAGRVVPSFTHRVVREMGSDRARVVLSNQRYVSRPGGWHSWPCAFATTLLMATDHDFGIILMGSGLEATLLNTGTGYFDRFEARRRHGLTGNYWQSAFNAVGLPVFSPVCGASTFATSRLSLRMIRSGRVFSCALDHGAPCMRCSKCLRKDLTRAAVDPAHTVRWGAYDRADIHEHLDRDPLPEGHVFSYSRRTVSGLPNFIRDTTADLPEIESQWPLRTHPATFEFCDPRWRPMIRERVLAHLEEMRPADIAEMQRWSSARCRT